MNGEFFSFLLAFIIFFSISRKCCSENPTCSLQIDDCSYTVAVKKNLSTCRNSKYLYYGNARKRRSVDAGKSNVNDGVHMELQKMRRKVGRLERRLTRSMEDLATRVLRGVRKIEQHIIGNHEKRDLRVSARTYRSLCPKGFTTIYNGDSCYLMSNFNATWSEAKDYCTALNSDLIALGSIREHNLISFLIKNSQGKFPIAHFIH